MQHQARHILDTFDRCYQVVPDCSAAAAHWRCTVAYKQQSLAAMQAEGSSCQHFMPSGWHDLGVS